MDFENLISKVYKCVCCPKQFGFWNDTARENSSVHEGIMPSKCELCEHSFSHKGSSNQHVPTIHGGTKPFKFGICDKRCMTGPILEKNYILAIMVRKGKALDFENLISKVYKCVCCPKQFGFWNDTARENSSVHEGIMPSKCELCEHSFSHKGSSNQHVPTIHGGTKPFKCGICDKRCMTGPILEKNNILAIMVRKGKGLDFENLISSLQMCLLS